MKYRELGKTGIKVSEVGFGAWQLGSSLWGGSTGKDAISLVHRAIDEGCTFFDTAPGYGEGQSEKLLGEALQGKRDRVAVVSKFGHNPDGSSDFSPGNIRRAVDRSLKALHCDYLDGVLLHNPEKKVLNGKDGHFEVLSELKKEGKIRAYGSSLDSSEELNLLMDNSDSEIAEVLFNVFNQETQQAFPRAKKEGLGLIVKVPLDSGWLSGKYNAQSVFTTGYRDRWTQDVKNRRSALVEKLDFLVRKDQTMAQAALRFILSFDQVSTVIPGAKKIDHLLGNLSASDDRLPQAVVQRLQQIWTEEIKKNPLPW
jgi:aryl-alcohol dehydrogenase-like predicted oxidoreductase